MKAHLMYMDRDFAPNPNGNKSPREAALTQDLELDKLFAAMSAGDAYLLEVARQGVLTSLHEPEAILHRQRILADCLERAAVVREMYAITVEAIEEEKKLWRWGSDRYPDDVLNRSVRTLDLFFGLLKKLRRIADDHGGQFRSEGFTRLFSMFATELDDHYLNAVGQHLRRLAFRAGVLMSAELGKGNKGAHYVLRTRYTEPRWWERIANWLKNCFARNRSYYVYRIPDHDDSGYKAKQELNNRGISLVANALGQSMDHILSFFSLLRAELGFYVGCLNLRDQLAKKGEPICFPEPLPAGAPIFVGRGLYDLCLSLTVAESIVGNDVNAAGKSLVMITGANRGGKSTLLRAMGLAQIMMQCGMFVPAESFRASVCDAIFTHFKREEDAGMRSGKLDEELSRMSSIADNLTSKSMVLFNESFASTNEREGSEIARQIVRALLEKGVKVFYVTHLYDLARGFHRAKMNFALFLRAERLADGRRTFRIVEGEPLPTSYGPDLYRRIFGEVGDVVVKTEASKPSEAVAASQSV